MMARGRFAIWKNAVAAGIMALSSTSVVGLDAGNAIPDPAAIKIPDLSGGHDADVVSNGWKYFYFWRADTSFAEAYADISDCYRFMPVANAQGLLPMFATWGQSPDVEKRQPNPYAYGLVGMAIGAIVAGPLERRAHQSRLRRCMEPRGYQRYPLQERRWEELTDNFSPSSIAMQAKAASGSAPDGAALPGDR
jgi:hypothetical protein